MTKSELEMELEKRRSQVDKMENRIKKLEKKIEVASQKMAFDEAADNLKMMMDSFVDAGFTREESMCLMTEAIKASFSSQCLLP